MTDEPMRERMARALCRNTDPDAVYESAGVRRKGWEWQLYAVDALLDVMETPSEAMIDAAVRE